MPCWGYPWLSGSQCQVPKDTSPGLQLPCLTCTAPLTPAPAPGRCYGHPHASLEQPEDISSWGEPFVFKSPCVNLTLNSSTGILWNSCLAPEESWRKGYCNLSIHHRQSPHLPPLQPATCKFDMMLPCFHVRSKRFHSSPFSFHLWLLDLSQLFLSDPLQACNLSEIIPDLSLAFLFAVVCPFLFFQTSWRKIKISACFLSAIS